MNFLAASTFGATDWGVLAGYFVLLGVTGWLFSRKGAKNTDDYFLGERKMPVWAVTISIIATAISAATFISVPAETFGKGGDLTYLSTNIGGVLGILIVARVFIPAFYKHRVSTVYQLLETSFGPGAKLAASWTFMAGRTFASGARLYIAAIALAMIIYGDAKDPRALLVAIVVLTVAGILYSLVGGIRSVIWTEVIQATLFVGAAIAAIALLMHKIPLSVDQMLETLRTADPSGKSKLTVFRLGLDPSATHFGFDPTEVYTLLTAVTGFLLMSLAAYGTDHDMVQRMLTCENALKGGRSAVAAIVTAVPVVALFAIIGLLLFVYYHATNSDGTPAAGYAIENPKHVFLTFILHEMPAGMRGVMMAGLFAAALSCINSTINSQSSTFVNDWFRPRFPGRSEAHYLLTARLAVVGWGVLQGGFAALCVVWQTKSGETLLQFALSVMTFAYAGLLGVFLTALFTGRGNTVSAIGAIAVGFFTVLVQQPIVWDLLDTGIAAPAFPWRLTSGTILATLACCCGRRAARPAMMRA